MIRDQRVTVGVGFVERVARERLEQLPDAFGGGLWVPVGDHRVNELRALAGHHFLFLLAHRAAEHIRLTQAVAGELADDLEHLVLVDNDAVALVEHIRQRWIRW